MHRAIVFCVLAFFVAACTGSSVLGRSVRSSTTSGATRTPVMLEMPAPLSLVVIGGSMAIPTLGCQACRGFDRQFAAHLEAQTGRPVELDSLARPNTRIADLQALLDTDKTVQDAIAGADVVIVSIGFKDGPPWGPQDPCQVAEPSTDIEWLSSMLQLTPSCIEASLDTYSDALATLYGRVAELAGDRPQVRVTTGVFNNLKGNPGVDGTADLFPPDDMRRVLDLSVAIFDQWNRMDCDAAKSHGFACADIYHAFNGPDGTGSVEDFVSDDFTHPSTKGQARMAQALATVDIGSLTNG